MNNEKSLSNSPIGSHHWFATLMGQILRVGEFLKDKSPDEEHVRIWGKNVYDNSRQIIEWWNSREQPKDNNVPQLKTSEPMSATMDSLHYLKQRGYKNHALDFGISGGGDGPRTRVSDVMLDFAKKYSRHKLIVLIEENDALCTAVENTAQLVEENERLKLVLGTIKHISNDTGTSANKRTYRISDIAEQALERNKQ